MILDIRTGIAVLAFAEGIVLFLYALSLLV